MFSPYHNTDASLLTSFADSRTQTPRGQSSHHSKLKDGGAEAGKREGEREGKEGICIGRRGGREGGECAADALNTKPIVVCFSRVPLASSSLFLGVIFSTGIPERRK